MDPEGVLLTEHFLYLPTSSQLAYSFLPVLAFLFPAPCLLL